VTGASRGIGARSRAAWRLRRARHRALPQRTQGSGARCRDIEASGGKTVLIEGDVAQRGVAERIVRRYRRGMGTPRYPHHNAGDQITRCPITDTPDDLFDRQMNINVRSRLRGVPRRRPAISQQGGGGVIINVGSVPGAPVAGSVRSLCRAKAFVATFSRSLAKEVAADRIRVNVVSPGVIATDMQDRVSTPAQIAAP